MLKSTEKYLVPRVLLISLAMMAFIAQAEGQSTRQSVQISLAPTVSVRLSNDDVKAVLTDSPLGSLYKAFDVTGAAFGLSTAESVDAFMQGDRRMRNPHGADLAAIDAKTLLIMVRERYATRSEKHQQRIVQVIVGVRETVNTVVAAAADTLENAFIAQALEGSARELLVLALRFESIARNAEQDVLESLLQSIEEVLSPSMTPEMKRRRAMLRCQTELALSNRTTGCAGYRP